DLVARRLRGATRRLRSTDRRRRDLVARRLRGATRPRDALSSFSMRATVAAFLLALLALPAFSRQQQQPKQQQQQARKTAWPLSLRDGLPKDLPGYTAAPSDPLPDTDENDMGVFTEVSRFYQKIESSTVARQFRLVVQDYGKDKDLEASIRSAVAESA